VISYKDIALQIFLQ